MTSGAEEENFHQSGDGAHVEFPTTVVMAKMLNKFEEIDRKTSKHNVMGRAQKSGLEREV